MGTNGIEWENCPVFSSPYEWIGKSKHFIIEVNRFWKPDIILQVFDLFTLWPQLRNYGHTLPLATYSPLDARPIAQVQWECAKLCKVVIPQCHFAKQVYQEAGIETSAPVYHGVDPKVYYPRTPAENAETRARYGIEKDIFLVLMVQDNTPRKNIPAQIKAFQNFKRWSGAKAHLLGIMPNMDVSTRGLDLDQLWEALRENDDECFTHRFGLEEDELARLYSAADVLLQGVHSEGFGLPVIEAGACGIPTIATDYGSLTELVGKRGWLVPGQVDYCQPATFNWQMTPSLQGMQDALMDAYEHPEKRKALGAAMQAFTLGECNWDRLAEKMAGILEAAIEYNRHSDSSKAGVPSALP